MKQIKNIFAIIVVVISLASCDLGKEPDIGGVLLQEMTGEWWVNIYFDGDPIFGYTLMSTYNTADNNTTDLFIDDHAVWPCKVVANADVNSMSMSGSTLNNLYDESIQVDVIEGKIIENAATTTGGNTTDSIYVRFKFSDDIDNEYVYAGYRRTGFLEDEH